MAQDTHPIPKGRKRRILRRNWAKSRTKQQNTAGQTKTYGIIPAVLVSDYNSGRLGIHTPGLAICSTHGLPLGLTLLSFLVSPSQLRLHLCVTPQPFRVSNFDSLYVASLLFLP